jgi:hypothetical protein
MALAGAPEAAAGVFGSAWRVARFGARSVFGAISRVVA